MGSTKEQWKRYAEALVEVLDADLCLARATERRGGVQSPIDAEYVAREKQARIQRADRIKAEIDTADLN